MTLSSAAATAVHLYDYEPIAEDLRAAVVAGLSSTPRAIASKFFYDARGSALFEQICELPSYYVTRTELVVLRDYLPAMASVIGPEALVIELGSGAGTKTRLLLEALERPAAYVPIDISREALLGSVAQLRRALPELPILPVCADYSQRFDPPEPDQRPKNRLVYFPGSTLGNLHPTPARRLFGRMRELAGEGGGLLIGVDRVKSPDILVPAYDDPEGVTAAFNLNLLERINREAEADFNLDRWSHRARWNARASRMESHLVSDCAQRVRVGEDAFDFEARETIWTECSYKYRPESVDALAEGFELVHEWNDPKAWFSVMYFRAT